MEKKLYDMDTYELPDHAPSHTSNVLYMSHSPFYLRCATPDGKTLWKTSKYLSCYAFEYLSDSNEVYDGEEIVSQGGNYDSPEGFLLYDEAKKEILLKKFDGIEIRLPKFLADYKIHGLRFPLNKWLFIHDDDRLYCKSEIALVDYSGNVEWRTKEIDGYINRIMTSPKLDRLL